MTNLENLLLVVENYLIYFDDLLSGERSLPFGLLVNRFIARLLLQRVNAKPSRSHSFRSSLM